MYEIHNHSILQLVFCPQNKILKQGRIFKISGDIGSGGEAGLEYRKIYWPLWYYKLIDPWNYGINTMTRKKLILIIGRALSIPRALQKTH